MISDPSCAPSPRTALVLNGGGVSAASFEIGCLAALDHVWGDGFCTDEIDVYIGASAGAIVTSLTAAGISPLRIRDEMKQGRHSLLDFTRSDVYQADPVDLATSLWESARTVASILSDQGRHWSLSLTDLLHVMQEQLPAGLFSLDPLSGYVQGLLDHAGRDDDFDTLGKRLLVPAIELDRGLRVVFGSDDAPKIPISTAVTASCAIPAFFRPREIEGRYFIDGAVSGRCHLDLALEAGAERVILVNPLVPVDYHPDRVLLPAVSTGESMSIAKLGIGYVSDQALRIEAHDRLEAALTAARQTHPDVEIILIQPSREDTLLFLNGPMSFDAKLPIMESAFELTRHLLTEQPSGVRPGPLAPRSPSARATQRRGQPRPKSLRDSGT